MSKHTYDHTTGIVYGKRGKPFLNVGVDGYLRTTIKGKTVKIHRFIFELMGVEIPSGMQVDHINHDKTDNRWCNLRVVTAQDNCRNRTLSTRNKSGVTGVQWKAKRRRWLSNIRIDYKLVHLGYFAKFSDAVDARKLAEVAYGFHVNHGDV